MYKFMECRGCKDLVKVNNTCICLSCQRGFIGIPQEDSYDRINEKKPILDEVILKKEDTDANKITSPESLPTRKSSKNCKEVGKRNIKKRKATKKSKEKG